MKKTKKDGKQWTFSGMPGESFSLVRLACVGYELYKAHRPGVFEILTDQEKFDKTAAEFGITMDAVREETRSMLYMSDLIAKYLRDDHADNAASADRMQEKEMGTTAQ